MLKDIAARIRQVKNTACSVVVVAAGKSVRMGEDKLFMDLCGEPVLARTLSALNGCSCVEEIILVTREDILEKAADLCKVRCFAKVKKVIVGGSTRSESVLAGLMEIDRDASLVLIHDGARPLVTEDLVYRVMHTAAIYKCAAPSVPVVDTVKEAEGDSVVKTLDRSRLAAIQTPQGFVPEIIKAALTKGLREKKEFTDDCAAVEAMGLTVRLTEGSPENIKITRPLDIQTAEAILRHREKSDADRTGV